LVQYLPRYLVEYADFCCLVQKGAVVNTYRPLSGNLWGYWTYSGSSLHTIVKISLVDPEIIGLRAIIKKRKRKKKEINISKIYSPVGKFAKRAKLECYLAW